MNYQEFLNYIKENFVAYYNRYQSQNEENVEEAEYSVELQRIIKNNGIVLDGMIIRKDTEDISPTIYLNSYFELYQMGKPLNVIFEEIILQYGSMYTNHHFEMDNLLVFSEVKNKIIVRLINYEKNRELLKTCPYKRFLDLAVTFRYVADRDCHGLASSLIVNEEFDEWGIELDELYQTALFNTMREFPWHMESLASVILSCLKRTMPEEACEEIQEEYELFSETENGVSIFVLSNDSDLNGASCILYDNVIKNFAKVQDSNVFILPSSIHEVMLVPESDDTDPMFLQELVVEANQSAVGLIDLLSDSIYYYDRETDQITIYGNS